jgi:tRNA pseudouridine55 synthase
MSSNQALQATRRLYQAEKAGHTGTLDPLATGLLPLCFGEATKYAGELLDADKRYVATVQLGVTTDTADAEGTPLMHRPIRVGRDDVTTALNRFTGMIEQIPPMYSALKRDGKPLYEYARAGIEVERKSRHVTIHSIQLLDWQPECFIIDVHCSKGTYIRTLAADLGEALGCGAHLTALRRTGIAALDITSALALSQLENQAVAERLAALHPIDFLLTKLPVAHLDSASAKTLLQGQPVSWSAAPAARLRIYGPTGNFLGVGRMDSGSKLHPERLIANPASN